MRDLFWLLGILFVLSWAVYMISGVNVWASDWKTNKPTVISRTEISNAAPLDMHACGGQESSISVSGIGSANRACVFGNSNSTRVARYGLSYAIAFPYSDQFYELRGVCVIAKCSYSSDADAILMHSQLGYHRFGVDLYKNFSKQIQRRFDLGSMRTYFQFEPTEAPSYRLKLGDMLLEGEATAFSANGRYAVIEARSYGFIRLDIETLESRRVIAPGATYGRFSDPYYELAVANDGTKVAIAGYRGDTSLYFVDSACGDTPGHNTLQYFGEGIVPCGVMHLEDVTGASNFYHSFQPRFNEAGSRLGVSILMHDSRVERFIYGLPVSDGAVQYIAMGDSFTSGEGEENDNYYQESRLGGDPRCHVSIRSYPYLIARRWNFEARSVACSGARTYDIGNSDVGYNGQSNILRSLSKAQAHQRKEVALGHFQSGILPQVSFISEYQPSISSIGIGGNDAGLMGKLMACLNLNTCEWAKDPDKRYATANEIRNVYSKIRETIAQIKNHSPGTDLVVIGYPQIISTAPNAPCGVVLNTLLTTEERVFISESITLLNQVVRSAAHAENVGFIDIESAFDRHKLCESTNAPAMNAVRIGDDIAPVSFLEAFRVIGAESFHPTPAGHQYIANAILSAKPGTDSLGDCGDCLPSTPPMLSEYWASGTTDDSPDGQYVHQIYESYLDRSQYQAGETIEIDTPKGVFAANSQVAVELHSEVSELKKVTVAVDGTIRTTALLPSDVPPGYHTVHSIGTAVDGRMIDLYTVIAIVDKKATYDAYSTNQYGVSLAKSEGDATMLTSGANNTTLLQSSEKGVEATSASDKSLSSKHDTQTVLGAATNSVTVWGWVSVAIVGLLVITATLVLCVKKYRSHQLSG